MVTFYLLFLYKLKTVQKYFIIIIKLGSVFSLKLPFLKKCGQLNTKKKLSSL